nr:hypothetical protein [Kineosporia sp. A_224]
MRDPVEPWQRFLRNLLPAPPGHREHLRDNVVGVLGDSTAGVGEHSEVAASEEVLEPRLVTTGPAGRRLAVLR